MKDQWGATLSVGTSASLDAWNTAWTQAVHFVDDPFLTLAGANASDDGFAMGPIFCGVYRILGGSRPDDAAVQTDLKRAQARAQTAAEHQHLEALHHMLAGNYTAAGQTWDSLAGSERNFAAVRFAHDVYLHVGDDGRRLRSSQQAFDRWSPGEHGWGLVAGQLSFALEEAGFYDDAEELGRAALRLDAQDLWARHSLAHLYETLDDSAATFALLVDHQNVWAAQDGLAVHLWWHLALRLIAVGSLDEALAIHDAQLPVATTPFRMCDLVSLLWRLELLGVDVGDRWSTLADRFAERSEWHTAAFLDLHAAFLFTRQPDHRATARFFDGVATSHPADVDGFHSENARNFATIVKPLVVAVRNGETDPAGSLQVFDALDDQLHRIGGSIAQRDILRLTYNHFERLAADPTKD